MNTLVRVRRTWGNQVNQSRLDRRNRLERLRVTGIDFWYRILNQNNKVTLTLLRYKPNIEHKYVFSPLRRWTKMHAFSRHQSYPSYICWVSGLISSLLKSMLKS